MASQQAPAGKLLPPESWPLVALAQRSYTSRHVKTDKYENENRYAAPKALEDETKKETKKRVKAEKIAAKKAKKRAKTWIGKREAMYPHGQECFCGCRHKAMQGKKKREGVIFYTMDKGVWVRDSAGASCVIM